MKYTIISLLVLCLVSPITYAKEKKNERHQYKSKLEHRNLKRQVIQNSERINDLSEQVEQMGNNTTGGDTSSGNLQQQVQANTNNISNLTTTVQSNTSTANANSNQLQNTTTNLNSLSAQVQTNTTNINSNTAQILNNSIANTTQDNQLSINANNINSNSNRITLLENGTVGGGSSTQTIDFANYIPASGSKQFQETTSSSSACTIVRHVITRVDNPADSDIHITESINNGIWDCARYDFDYKLLANSLSVVAYKDHSISNVVTFDNPGVVLSNTMEVGNSFGFASADITDASQVVMSKSTLLGIDSVSVPAGVYVNCLKIETKTKSNFIISDSESVSWHCPGVGEVKRVMHNSNDDSYASRVLISIQ